DPEVIDPRHPPVAGLHDDVHGAPLELRQPELEAVLLELLPRDARLDRDVLVADPPVPRDEVEPEPPDVPSLDVAQLRGDQVVVEEVHGRPTSLSSDVDSPSLLTPWTLEPLQVVPTVVAALLYYARC